MRRRYIVREIKKKFECQRCNHCCEAPGFVYIEQNDIEPIATFLKLKCQDFLDQYCRYEDGLLVLDQPEQGACQFLNEQGCQIHEVKPKQCRQFPRVWRDPDAFDYCEGIKKIVRNIESVKTRKEKA